MKKRTDCSYWMWENFRPYVMAPNGNWVWVDDHWIKDVRNDTWNARQPVDMPRNWWKHNFGDLPDLPEEG